MRLSVAPTTKPNAAATAAAAAAAAAYRLGCTVPTRPLSPLPLVPPCAPLARLPGRSPLTTQRTQREYIVEYLRLHLRIAGAARQGCTEVDRDPIFDAVPTLYRCACVKIVMSKRWLDWRSLSALVVAAPLVELVP